MNEGCCHSPRKAPRGRAAFILGALPFLLPKCPACIPGLLAVLSAAGIQVALGAGLIFSLKVGAAAFLVWKLLPTIKSVSRKYLS